MEALLLLREEASASGGLSGDKLPTEHCWTGWLRLAACLQGVHLHRHLPG